ncbi:MAG TPA: hypothetical protein PKD70_14045, partial [Saprospiraceae bacterium]|nr:hypothetical protein [Saprospiraceae bacterium]HMP14995.1 hypothetical protein [Saprospiraceae bacterium]
LRLIVHFSKSSYILPHYLKITHLMYDYLFNSMSHEGSFFINCPMTAFVEAGCQSKNMEIWVRAV